LIARIKEKLDNPNTRKILFLTASKYGAFLLSYINLIFISRLISLEDFGIFKFYFYILATASLFFELGIFTSGSKMLANYKKAENIKQLTALLFYILFGLMVAFTFFELILIQYSDVYFNINIGEYLNKYYLISAIMIVSFPVQLILQGIGKIINISIFTFVMPFFISIMLFISYIFNISLNIENLLLITLVANWLSFLFIIYKVKLIGIKESYISKRKELSSDIKTYGFKIFISRSIDTFSYSLDTLFLAKFYGAKEVGLYSLGVSVFFGPLIAIFQSIGIVFFRKIPDMTYSELKNKLKNIYMLSFIFLLTSYIILYFLFTFLFTEEYHGVLNYVYLFFILAYISANNQFYYYIFQAKGKSNIMFTNSMINVVLNIIGNSILVPLYSITGAIIASILSLSMGHLYMYSKLEN
jgi:O-antigen/teichoic acid export membrane protein